MLLTATYRRLLVAAAGHGRAARGRFRAGCKSMLQGILQGARLWYLRNALHGQHQRQEGVVANQKFEGACSANSNHAFTKVSYIREVTVSVDDVV